MIINERFPILSTVAKILFITGILTVATGLFSLLLELIEVLKFFTTTGAEWIWSRADIVKIIIFFASTFSGLIIMAIAEVIGVLFAIEKNTRT